MALAGTVKSTTYDGRGVMLTWNATQDVTNNKSVIEWELNGYGEGSVSWYRAGPFQVTINGTTTTIAATSPRLQLYNGTIIKNGKITIPHNANGTKSFTISIKAAIYSTSYNCSGSETFTLDTIPKGATITSADNFTDEENPTVYYNNPYGTNVDDILACISFDRNADNIEYRSIDSSAVSYTFYLTDEERETIRNYCTTSNSMTVYFYIRTIIDGVKYHSSVAKTVTIVNCSPTFTVEYADVNETASTLTGNAKKIIRGFNNVLVSCAATAKKGATIDSVKITNNGETQESILAGFTNTTDNKFIFKVTDSRGNTASNSVTADMVEYFNVSASSQMSIQLDSGSTSTYASVTVVTNGNFYNGSFGAEDNALYIDIYMEQVETGLNYTKTIEVPASSIDGNTFSHSYTETTLPYESKWKFQVSVYDKVSKVTLPPRLLSAKPVYDWSETDFNFNVPVTYDGTKKLFYLPGDTIEFANNEITVAGFCANGGKDLYFTIPINKPIFANTITVDMDDTYSGVLLRGINGYANIAGSTSLATVTYFADCTSSTISLNEVGIGVKMSFSNTINANANNTPMTVTSYPLKFILGG